MAEALSSHLVVIGASAGGIEALSTLVGSLPADLPSPIIIAQHLDPSRPSHLATILARASRLPVQTVTDSAALQPGTIYVVPPDRDIIMADGAIQLVAGSQRSRPSIDRLFASAAEVYGENLIAVILTGSGHDGAAGALDVQQLGGTVIVQDPDSAAFPALPRSLAPSVVDFIVPLEKIGDLITNLLQRSGKKASNDEQESLALLLRLIHEQFGVDFRPYKQATIFRRVQRRMAVTGASSIAEYVRMARRDTDEQQALIATFLIKVTQFFRDPNLFAALRDHILPNVVETARQRDHTIRLWSAGCATGEEAYSLAILLAEVLGDEFSAFHVRIFATDLDDEAITFARQGLYPASRLTGVDLAIVDRYFDVVDGGLQVSKTVRGLMVFGQHDLAERAPFPRVDLVLCRNVLIYFTPDLQRRILQLFAFSLRAGGYLILGKSETTSPFADCYVVDDQHLKVYRRRDGQPIVPAAPLRDMTTIAPPRVTPTRPSLYGRTLTPPPSPPASREHAHSVRADAILFGLPVGIVVVDRRYDIQYINDAARTHLGIHGLALGEDVIHLVRTLPGTELRSLIDRALAGEQNVSGTLTAVHGGDDTSRYLRVTCALSLGEADPDVIITVADGTSTVEEQHRLEEALSVAQHSREQAEQQRAYVASANEQLLSINQQLTREIAELRSQNEEYLVGNEELQAAAEEVETLNEELQATNEELETLNEELQATVEELNTTNDDLQTRNLEIQDLAVRLETARSRLHAVLNSLGESIAVVDREGRTTLTNARYDETFGAPVDTIDILDADGGRRVPDERPHRRAARGEAFQTTFALPSADGQLRIYHVVGHPILGTDDGGGVLVIRIAENS